MAPPSKIGYLLERVSQGVAAHDRENPGHHTWGIGMAYFDIERLGLEEGEEILPGIVLQADGGMTGQFRILCDGDHGEGRWRRKKRSSTRSPPRRSPSLRTRRAPDPRRKSSLRSRSWRRSPRAPRSRG